MENSYIILIDHDMSCHSESSRSSEQEPLSMMLKAKFPGGRIFASRATPVLHLCTGTFLIGELYSKKGGSLTSAHQIQGPSTQDELRRHILRECWGDYVLVESSPSGPGPIRVMRNPSPVSDIQCVYPTNLESGFVTSDISLAVRLGLYQERFDIEHITHRLAFPGLKGSRTGLAGISELLPGCAARFWRRSVYITQEWNPSDFVAPDRWYSDSVEAESAVRQAIEMVVAAWARNEAPTLLELSGGLDSSIVGLALKSSGADLICTNLLTATPGADEREYASLMAQHIQSRLIHHQLDYENAEFEFTIPPPIVTPAVGPLQYAIDKAIESMADREAAGSYFSGAGGDTVFGYLTNASPAADAFRAEGLTAGFRAIRDLSAFHQCTYWKAGRLTLRKLTRHEAAPHETDRSMLSPRLTLPEPEPHPWLDSANPRLPGYRQRLFELSATQFLRDSCVRSLSRRLRMPLLSQPVIEACLRTPTWMWFSGGQNRSVARQAFADSLPPPIYRRRSKGTFTSYLGGLYRRRRDRIFKFLLEGQLHSHGLLDDLELHRLAQLENVSSRDIVIRIFHLCMLENWARQRTG